MQRLIRMRGEERGAIAVTVTLLLIPILVCFAFVVDSGLLYWEKAQLQNGADAAALAVASDCAEAGPACMATSQGVASDIAGANANDNQANATLPSADFVVNAGSGRVRVIASTLNDEGTALRHPFASLLGPSASTVTATAATEWGAPVAGTVIPLAIASCELTQIETDPNLARQIFLRSDNAAQTCPGSYPGGFGWLDDGDGDCSVDIDVDGFVEGHDGQQPREDRLHRSRLQGAAR